jgi:hypothetical protein
LCVTADLTANVSVGSITSLRAGKVDFRFALDTGRFAASQRTVETGHNWTRALQQKPGYSITAAATAISVGRTSMPSALAVFRLMANSNLIGRALRIL